MRSHEHNRKRVLVPEILLFCKLARLFTFFISVLRNSLFMCFSNENLSSRIKVGITFSYWDPCLDMRTV